MRFTEIKNKIISHKRTLRSCAGKLSLLAVFLLPLQVTAATSTAICPKVGGTGYTFKCLVMGGLNIVSWIIPIIISLAVVAFMWGVIKYIVPAGDEGKVKEGRNMMIYGIIGIAVMVSVWGLVKIVNETFFGSDTINTDSVQPMNIPDVNPGNLKEIETRV